MVLKDQSTSSAKAFWDLGARQTMPELSEAHKYSFIKSCKFGHANIFHIYIYIYNSHANKIFSIEKIYPKTDSSSGTAENT